MLLWSAFKRQTVGVQNTVVVLILCFVWWLYVCLGAAIIQSLETPVQKRHLGKVAKFVASFLENHKCVSEHDLDEFINGVETAARMGVSASLNVTGDDTWNFANAIFFAGTLITTIGYGNTAPLSDWGKVFCIIYAAIGVPLTLIMFTALVERLMIPTSLILQYLVDKLVPRGVQPFRMRLAHLGIVLGVIVIFLVLIPSIVFTSYEPKWTFLDAFYFCVVSLMTIGLGDIVPGEDPSVNYNYIYKLCTTIYIAVGLLFVMLLLAVVYEIPEFNLGLHLSMRSDEFEEKGENVRLTNVGVNLPPRYMTQVDEPAEGTNQVPNGNVGPPSTEIVAAVPTMPNDVNSTNENWPRP